MKWEGDFHNKVEIVLDMMTNGAYYLVIEVMEEINMMSLRDKLVHEVTAYDIKESTKRGYNRYGLGIMLEAVNSAMEYIDAGKDVRKVLVGHFTGRLLTKLLKVAGCAPDTREDQMGTGVRRDKY